MYKNIIWVQEIQELQYQKMYTCDLAELSQSWVNQKIAAILLK